MCFDADAIFSFAFWCGWAKFFCSWATKYMDYFMFMIMCERESFTLYTHESTKL